MLSRKNNRATNVIIRADSSTYLGSGHIMRCLTLAKKLRQANCNVAFVCRDLPGNMIMFIEQAGYKVYKLVRPDVSYSLIGATEDSDLLNQVADAAGTISLLSENGAAIDWIIVDQYEFDHVWEQYVRPFCRAIMVIDDLANRKHDCDLLLDQNLYINSEARYRDLVPTSCRVLLGPQFALLRDEFYLARQSARPRMGKIDSIFIFFGSADLTNETGKVLCALKKLQLTDNVEIDVVVGAINPHRCELEKLAASMPNVRYYCQVSNMAEMMVKADIAIGAGGSTTWERCCLGLPAFIITVAQNQVELVKTAHELGAVRYLGHYDQVTEDTIMRTLKAAFYMPDKIKRMSEVALQLTGTLPGPQQILTVMSEVLNGK